MANKDFFENYDWIKTLYSESWSQYSHEDNLLQSRNSMFLSTFAVLLSASSAIVSFLLSDVELDNSGLKKFNLLIAGLIILFFALLAFVISKYWKRVTSASRSYINLRFLVAKEIEEKYFKDEIGIAKKEDHWRRNEKPSNYIGGILSTEFLIRAVQYICLIYGVLGFFLIVLFLFIAF